MAITDTFFRFKPERERERERMLESDAVGLLVLALWKNLCASFRPDEQTVEAAHFELLCADISLEITSLKPGEIPKLPLMQRILAVLAPEVTERIADLHARIDELADTCRSVDRDLNLQKLAGSWQTDEIERCRIMLTQRLRTHKTPLPEPVAGNTAPLISQLLASLLHVTLPPIPSPAPVTETPVIPTAGRIGQPSGRHAVAAHSRKSIPVGRPSSEASSHAEATLPLATPSDSQPALICETLFLMLEGKAHAPQLSRVLNNPELAQRLADLTAEHHSYRQILQGIGTLHKD